MLRITDVVKRYGDRTALAGLSLSVEAGEPLPVDADQLAAVFGTSSDGFSQMALVDPDAASHYGLLLDLVVRGLRTLADEQHEGGDD